MECEIQDVALRDEALGNIALRTWATDPIAPGSPVWIGFDPGRDKCGRAIVGLDPSADGNRLDQARLDQARLDPSRLNPSRLDPSRLDPSRLDQARLDQSRLDQYVIADLAVVRSPQAVVQLQEDCQRYCVQAIALGNSTTSRQWHQDLHNALTATLGDAAPPLISVDERNTTLEARDRYWMLFPPRGLQRLIPSGLRLPPRPVDDVAALLLLERYFNQHRTH